MDKKLIELLEKQTSILQALASQNAVKSVGASPTYTELHGVGSLFGSQSVEREVISAHVRPHGLASRLTRIPTTVEDPRFASLTGFTGTTGDNPVNPCDDAPAAYVKSCNLTAQFGRLMFDTQTIEFDKVMLRANRGDFTDLILYGQIFGGTNMSPITDQRDILNIVTKMEMVTAGVQTERTLSRHLWQGTPANNTAGGGYKEMPGLDSQIATGQVDADTNALCPALDSDVKDFGYDLVGGTGRDIVEYVSMLEYYLRYNARHMGLDPVTWVVVMRPELWFELSSVWPCRYLTNRCQDSAGSNVAVINDNVNTSMRDAMRNGMYIDINGNRYEVITDTGIFEHTNVNNASVALGEYASSIYFVPLSIVGGLQVTYMNYLNYRDAFAMSNVALLRGSENFWTDNGIFSWAIEKLNWCYKLKVKTEQRVVLKTPQLAGKIDAVKYTPLQHLREPYPDSPYFADGGVSLRADATKYAVWL